MTPACLVVQTALPLADLSAVLDYLAQALAEDDPACLAYALAVVAAERGIACVAMPPLPTNENGPSGPFVGLPGPFSGGQGDGCRDELGQLPEFGL